MPPPVNTGGGVFLFCGEPCVRGAPFHSKTAAFDRLTGGGHSADVGLQPG